MNHILLTDIDSLLLQVRDPNSLQYIQESVISFRSGAYRASIVSTWVALVYDFISKIGELAVNGDPAAATLMREIEIARTTNDIKRFLNLENEILDKALQFELITTHEKFLLSTIKDARNLCAHPAFDKEENLFIPTSEIARAHLVHSLKFVLIQKPVQGQAALNNFVNDLSSTTFPKDKEEVESFLKNKYLNRAKHSFIRNGAVILLKSIITNNVPNLIHHESNVLLAFNVFLTSKRDETLHVLREKLNILIKTNDPLTLLNFFKVLQSEQEIMHLLTPENKIAVKNLITQNINNSLTHKFIYKSIQNPEVSNEIIRGVAGLNDQAKLSVLSANIAPELNEIVINFFAESGSYESTRDRGFDVLTEYAKHFRVADLKALLEKIVTNRQIYDYVNFDDIIKDVFESTQHILEYTRANWRTFAQHPNILKNNYIKLFMNSKGILETT